MPAIHVCGILAHLSLLTGVQYFCLQVYGSGVALAMVACVPDWPWFNRHPQKWQTPQKVEAQGSSNAKRKQVAN